MCTIDKKEEEEEEKSDNHDLTQFKASERRNTLGAGDQNLFQTHANTHNQESSSNNNNNNSNTQQETNTGKPNAHTKSKHKPQTPNDFFNFTLGQSDFDALDPTQQESSKNDPNRKPPTPKTPKNNPMHMKKSQLTFKKPSPVQANSLSSSSKQNNTSLQVENEETEQNNSENISIRSISRKSSTNSKISRTQSQDITREKQKAYTLVYQKDIEIAFLLLAKKELQMEQTLKVVQIIQANEIKIPDLDRQLNETRIKIAKMLQKREILELRKIELTEDVVQIEQNDTARATLLEPYRENFEDFKEKKQKSKNRKRFECCMNVLAGVLSVVYLVFFYPVFKLLLNSF